MQQAPTTATVRISDKNRNNKKKKARTRILEGVPIPAKMEKETQDAAQMTAGKNIEKTFESFRTNSTKKFYHSRRRTKYSY